MTSASDKAVRSYVAENSETFFEELKDWLRIPAISSDPDRRADIRRSADWLAAKLREVGFPVVEVWDTAGGEGLPTVFAEWPSGDAGAPTVAVYGHHDVQPVTPLELWDTPPFEPTVKGDRLYARGAADDKGQLLFHILGVRAHLNATGRTTPAVNLKIIAEGEEESGSPNFRALLEEKRDRVKADVVVVSDTGMWGSDTPSVCTAMRGMITGQVDFHGPANDVHSGSFGGGIPNPLTELVRLLGSVHDADKHITIPGFYDGVVELTDTDRELFAKLPFDEKEWLADAKSTATAGEAGFSTLERVWARPTFELNGFWGGHTGPGHKTIVPSAAHAKVSMRLVAGQDPLDIRQKFESWFLANVPAGLTATTHWESDGVKPCMTPLDHPALQAVTRSMGKAFGEVDAPKEILYTREGGSGPEADLQDVLEAPVVFLGVSLPSDGWHSPNESMSMPLLLKGAEAAAHLWSDLGAHGLDPAPRA
jgi:acetylornithine deacetylase/succinyl-diaminopimelate desuccinylase-like protein